MGNQHRVRVIPRNLYLILLLLAVGIGTFFYIFWYLGLIEDLSPAVGYSIVLISFCLLVFLTKKTGGAEAHASIIGDELRMDFGGKEKIFSLAGLDYSLRKFSSGGRWGPAVHTIILKNSVGKKVRILFHSMEERETFLEEINAYMDSAGISTKRDYSSFISQVWGLRNLRSAVEMRNMREDMTPEQWNSFVKIGIAAIPTVIVFAFLLVYYVYPRGAALITFFLQDIFST